MTGIAPHTDEWHAARAKGIGASEIAAVLGISPRESPFSLYWRKVNGWEADLSAVMEWGNRLERVISHKFADEHPEYFLSDGHLEAAVAPSWMVATPDFFVWQADPPPQWMRPVGLLECKTAHSADGWGESGGDDIPVHYRAQTQWQMAVCDMNWCAVAVLIGGSDYREYLIRRDEKDIAVMVTAARRFMARIEAGDPPPLDDHDATLTTLKRLHPDLVDEQATVPDDIAAGYLRAARMKRLAEKVIARYEAQIRSQAGAARTITTADGRKVATHVITDVAAEKEPRGPHRKDYLLAALPKGKS